MEYIRRKREKKKKLNKIAGVLGAVLIAICLAFGTADFVYATDYNDEWVENWWENWVVSNVNAQPVVLTGASTSVFHGYHDVTFSIHVQYFFSGQDSYAHNGLLTSSFRLDLTQDMSWPVSDYTVTIEGYDVTSDHDVVMSQSQRVYTNNNNVSYTTSIDFTIWNYLHNYEYVNSCDVNVIVHARWWFWNGSRIAPIPTASVTHTDFDYVNTSGNYDNNFLLASIANKLETLVTSDNITLLESIDNNLKVDDDVIEDQESRAQEAESLINDYDYAIASAAPEATHQISNVGTLIENNGMFWSAQQNAVTFWRDCINLAFDFSVVSYLATGLSIVLIIILFIFVLRL